MYLDHNGNPCGFAPSEEEFWPDGYMIPLVRVPDYAAAAPADTAPAPADATPPAPADASPPDPPADPPASPTE